MNFYQILRVNEKANDLDIRSNYEYLKKNTTDPLELAKIECAYETLTKKRAEYDIMIMTGNAQSVPDISNIRFENEEQKQPKSNHTDGCVMHNHERMQSVPQGGIHHHHHYYKPPRGGAWEEDTEWYPKNGSASRALSNCLMWFIIGFFAVGMLVSAVSLIDCF